MDTKHKTLAGKIAESPCFKKRGEGESKEKSATSGPKYASLAEKLLMESDILIDAVIRRKIWNQRLASRKAQEPERRSLQINLGSPRRP